MNKNDPIKNFFINPENSTQKRYEALRAFFCEDKTAQQVAKQFNYTISSVYSLIADFKEQHKSTNATDYFFVKHTSGRKPKSKEEGANSLIISLRKKYLSVPDIKAIVDSQGYKISEKYIYDILKKEGFIRLPRRDQQTKINAINSAKNIHAVKSQQLKKNSEAFNIGDSLGVLCLLPYIKKFGIDKIIETSGYPSTQTLPALNSILCFIALKLSNVRRYSSDDIWCMNRGLGLFAGLNVLPKTAWFTSYSHRVTRDMNIKLLKGLNKLLSSYGYLSDTANLDFTAIPYWGEASHLENNWSGKRGKALESILAVLAQDPDTGIITYGDTNVRHNNEAETALEFLDFYTHSGNKNLKYLVFDSKFTTYQNLSKLNDRGIKFITIRRRGKNIVANLDKKENSEWQKIRITQANGRTKEIKIIDSMVNLKGYTDKVRQISITGHGKIKPALIITNDFELNPKSIVQKYSKRWLVEQEISEQIHFFHLNKVSSSVVIKVDFDLTMTILAHNLLRLFAADLTGFSHNSAITLYEKFLQNSGFAEMNDKNIIVSLKKKRNLPLLLTALQQFKKINIPWLHNRNLTFVGASTS